VGNKKVARLTTCGPSEKKASKTQMTPLRRNESLDKLKDRQKPPHLFQY
jgi:hypothetical protein